MNARDRLIVALDIDTLDEAKKMIDVLAEEVDVFKVGIAPFTAFGEELIDKISSLDKKCFLDLKVHDIPNTVANAACAAARKGVFMMNFHCLGGLRMLEAAVRSVKKTVKEESLQAPILLGVTVLTSMNEEDLLSIGVTGAVQDKVKELAILADNAGLDGVVASAKEAKIVKENTKENFVVVTPGIRPDWAAKGDQKRVLSPKQAMEEGADYIVVGRPIIQADNPKDAARKIIEEMEE